jgi:hypothetical protein
MIHNLGCADEAISEITDDTRTAVASSVALKGVFAGQRIFRVGRIGNL